jgi:hypothetical protein
MTFTLSQTGMVVHWNRARRNASSGAESRAHLVHFWINAVGALTTGVALIVIMIAKFEEGAWITLLIIPIVILLLKAIRNYYDELAAHIRDSKPLELRDIRPPIILVTTEGWNKLTDKALRLALSLSPDVIGVHLAQLFGPDAEEDERKLRAQWEIDVARPARAAGLIPPRLMILQAQYRAIHEPVLKLVQELEAKFGPRSIAVLVPEVVKQQWYQHLLHTHRARHLRSQLIRHGGSRVTVINVPWYLDEACAEAADQSNMLSAELVRRTSEGSPPSSFSRGTSRQEKQASTVPRPG